MLQVFFFLEISYNFCLVLYISAQGFITKIFGFSCIQIIPLATRRTKGEMWRDQPCYHSHVFRVEGTQSIVW